MDYKRLSLVGAWVAQLVKHPTLAQVMISQFMGSSPMSGSVLTAQSLEPASNSVSPSVSAPSLLMLSLSLSKINKLKKKKKQKLSVLRTAVPCASSPTCHTPNSPSTASQS